MNRIAILLIIISTFMHVAWNLIVKHQKDEFIFFKKFLIWMIIIGSVPFILLEIYESSFPVNVWICVFFSGMFCAVYYYSLAASYESHDFTIIYPLIRALPVLLVGFGDVLLGHNPNLLGWLGMTMVCFGCIAIPYNSFKEIKIKNYLNKLNIWVFGGAIGTTVYSLSDNFASDFVTPGIKSAFRYAYIFFAITTFFYIIMLKIFNKTKSKKSLIINNGNNHNKLIIFGAVMNFSAYWFVIWAYQLSRQTGYVVALRQFGIVLGIIMGLLFLKEKVTYTRIISGLLIFTGIMIISVFG